MIEIFFPRSWSDAYCEAWLASSQYWPGLVHYHVGFVTWEDMSQYVWGYDK